MVLTDVTWISQIEKWVESIDSITEGMQGIESIIGVGGLIAGVVATVWQIFISICTILSAYNIEIALMTKKERVKVNATSIAVLTISLSLLNLLFTHMAVTYVVEEWVINWGVVVIFALAMSILCITALLFCIGFARKISDIQVCRFIGVIIKKILGLIGARIYKWTSRLRSFCREIANTISDWKVIKAIRRGYVRLHDKLVQIWIGCAKDKPTNNFRKLTFSQELRLFAFSITTILGIVINLVLAACIREAKYIYLLSILVTIITVEIGLLFLRFQITPQDSRIYYYDDVLQKEIHIFFRQSESHCIGGDAEILGECNELFLVSYEKLQKQKLHSVSRKQKKKSIDIKKVRLQNERNEFMLNEVCNKIDKELLNQETTHELIDTADIYIKIDDKKAYYVLENGTSGEIDL